MKSLIFISVFFLIGLASYSQSVSINNDGSLPNASAILDVKSNTKGMLLPRTSTTSRNMIVNPAKGLIVYDTTTSGFWFHNGTAWAQLSGAGNGWNLTGNSGTDPSTNFMGTTDNQPLRFRVNNTWVGELDPVSANVFLGLNAGQSNTSSGTGNTGVGGYALTVNTTGYDNTAVGGAALYTNIDGKENTAIGRQSLFYNTNGSGNTATGYKALRNNNTGYSNTASGASALFSNTTGNSNIAYGYGALQNNTVGSFNYASGYEALYSNTTGIANCAYGYQALYANTSGGGNTAYGNAALIANNTGSNNIANGIGALRGNTTGDYNIAIGINALSNNIGGDYNIAIGSRSGTHSSTPNIYNTISIGNDDILNAYQNQVIIGNTSTAFIGGKVNWGIVSDARIKNTVMEDVKGLDFILRLRPVTYHISNKAMTTLTGNKETPDFPGKYDGEKIKYSGFLAQEVEQAAKDSKYEFSGYDAPKNELGFYTIKYAEFVVPLVKAMQEQHVIIETLQKQVEASKAAIPMQIGEQQTIIEDLKKQMAQMKNEIKLLKKKN